MSPRDPRWLGAWWLGFLVFGGAGLFVGIPLIFFPKAMHRRRALDAFKQKQMEDKKAMQKCWHDFKGIQMIHHYKILIKLNTLMPTDTYADNDPQLSLDSLLMACTF